jgi:hypothetical protein
VAEHGLQRVVPVDGAGVEFCLQEGLVPDDGSVGVLLLLLRGVGIAKKGAAVLLDVSEGAEAEADNFGDAPLF